MVLTKEQIVELKAQLKTQIRHLPDEQKAEALRQIDELSDEALEEILRQQAGYNVGSSVSSQKGIFRMIVDGDISSRKVNENKVALAVISVKAVSRGHVLIIPRKPVGDANSLPSGVFALARIVAKRIGMKLGSRSTEIQTENAFGEMIVDVIPVYDKPVSLTSPRYDVSDKELIEVEKLLKVFKKEKIDEIRIVKNSKELPVLKLHRRVP